MRRPLLLAVLLAAALASPAGAAVVGLSDQHADSFGDARARALGLQHARLVAPSDAATTAPVRVQA